MRDGANAHDAVTVRCLEAVVALHRGNFDSALTEVEELLALELYETHLAVPLGMNLANVVHAIDEVLAVPAEPTAELSAAADRIRARQRASCSTSRQRHHAQSWLTDARNRSRHCSQSADRGSHVPTTVRSRSNSATCQIHSDRSQFG